MPLTPPKYCRQKRKDGLDLAFVNLRGQRYYLGRYGTPESRREYQRLLAEVDQGGGPPVDPHHITIMEVAERFLTHAQQYYVKADGTRTSSLHTVKMALRPLKDLYGDRPAREFGPKALRAIRGRWIDAKLARTTVNDYTNTLKLVFKWATSHELIPGHVYHALRTVDGLRRHRSGARENDPVKPVPQDHIHAIRGHVSRQVWALVQLQLLTGARPGELVGLRAVDLNTSGKVWTAKLSQHKTAHHGHQRTIYFGPQAQDIINPFLTSRAVDAFLFSPREAEQERKAAGLPQMKRRKRANPRRPDQKPNPTKTERKVRERYDGQTYRRAITRACKAAGVPEWSPNQLRHNAATKLRHEHGIDLAQTILGHRLGSSVTEIYAEANEAKAQEVVLMIG